MDVFCIDSVDIDSIECIRDPYPVSTVSIYIVYIAMLLYIVYGILFVDTVDTKIKAHNAFNSMFVETLALTQHLIQSTMRCENTSINSLNIAQHSMHCML